jgi:hypothetical protein
MSSVTDRGRLPLMMSSMAWAARRPSPMAWVSKPSLTRSPMAKTRGSVVWLTSLTVMKPRSRAMFSGKASRSGCRRWNDDRVGGQQTPVGQNHALGRDLLGEAGPQELGSGLLRFLALLAERQRFLHVDQRQALRPGGRFRGHVAADIARADDDHALADLGVAMLAALRKSVAVVRRSLPGTGRVRGRWAPVARTMKS